MDDWCTAIWCIDDNTQHPCGCNHVEYVLSCVGLIRRAAEMVLKGFVIIFVGVDRLCTKCIVTRGVDGVATGEAALKCPGTDCSTGGGDCPGEVGLVVGVDSSNASILSMKI